MFEFTYLIILLPFVGFLINGIVGKKLANEKLIGLIGCLAVGIPFCIAASIF
jgi:NADH-quinone oxidoreductase subunit L